MSNRRAWVGLGAVVLGGVALASWVVTARIQTPEQAAADAAEPPAAMIFHEVRRDSLVESVVIEGQVVAPSAQTLGTAVGANDADGLIVTRTPFRPGDRLEEGAVVVEVSGRPLLLAVGDLPVWRDLRPGMTGADVRQLNASLARQGFLGSGADDDQFTAETSDAVADWYEVTGYSAPLTRVDFESAIRDAQTALRGAEAALTGTERALALAAAGPSEFERLAEALALESAQRFEEGAIAALKELTDGPLPEVAEARAELDSLVAAADALEAKIQQAKERLDSATKEQEDAIRSAKDDLADAAGGRRLAELSLRDLVAPANTDELEREVAGQRAAVDDARAVVDAIQGSEGVMIPASELLFVPSDTAVLLELNYAIGEAVTDDLGSVSSGELLIEAYFPTGEQGVSEGQEVEVEGGSATSGTVAGRVVHVSATTALDPVTGRLSNRFLVAPADPLAPSELGQPSVIRVESGRVEDELIVPISAIYSDAAGSTFVLVESGSGIQTVPVSLLLVADGWVAVDSSRLSVRSSVLVSR